jgi:hypothetical protein
MTFTKFWEIPKSNKIDKTITKETKEANRKDKEEKKTKRTTYYLIVEEWIVGCRIER